MKQGILLALATALISGLANFANKIFVSDMDPVVFTTLKNLFVAIVLTLFITRPKLLSSFKKLNRADWIKLVLIGIIGGSIPFALFFTGLKVTESISAALIHKTLFIWVAALAIPFLKEKLNIYQAAGYVIVLVGVLWGAGIKFTGDIGEQMIFAATILWAVENVIAKVALKSIPSELVAWARMTIGVVILFGIVFWQGNISAVISLSSSQLQSVIVSGAILTGYVLTWYKALSKAPATVVSSVLVLATPITALLSSGFLKAPFPQTLLISFVLTAVGIFVITKRAAIKL